MAHLLEKGTFGKIKQDGGRLRSFLLTSLRNFITDQVRRDRAKKRGGGQRPISMDLDGVEALFAESLAESETPQGAFENQWALSLVEEGFVRVETEYQESARGDLFEALCPFLDGNNPARTYAEIGESLGMSVGAVKVAVHRLRQRYRRHFERVVLETVEGEAELAEEMSFIQLALGR